MLMLRTNKKAKNVLYALLGKPAPFTNGRTNTKKKSTKRRDASSRMPTY